MRYIYPYEFWITNTYLSYTILYLLVLVVPYSYSIFWLAILTQFIYLLFIYLLAILLLDRTFFLVYLFIYLLFISSSTLMR